MMKRIKGTLLLACLSLSVFSQSNYSLDFNPENYQKQTIEFEGKKIIVRAYEQIPYVTNPDNKELQVMNIYIPEAYFKKKKNINGYTAATAPIFFTNKISGYNEAQPATALQFPGAGGPMGAGAPPADAQKGQGNGGPQGGQPGGFGGGGGPQGGGGGPQGGFGGGGPQGGFGGGGPQGGLGGGAPQGGEGRPQMNGTMQNNAGFQPQSAIAMALSRGYIVASAGARGRKSRSVSGTYSGKAPAAIVDLKAAICYLKYNDKVMSGDASKIISNGTSAGGALSALLGATGNNPDYFPYLKEIGAAQASDDIFAVSAYCPITNLENADMAYEWQFNGINEYRKNSEPGTLSVKQKELSDKLKAEFPAYLNSLQLKDAEGNALTLDSDGNGSFKNYIRTLLIQSAQKAQDEGRYLTRFSQLKIENKKVVDVDWQAQIKYMGRMKTPSAFDAVDLSSGENELFGDADIQTKHFTTFGLNHSGKTSSLASDKIVKMMNPLYYIGDAQTQTAAHWHIRHGTNDKDTGLAIPVILGTVLQNKGYDVNLELAWDRLHSGDYELEELFNWLDNLCKAK